MKTLVLPTSIAKQIQSEGASAYPNECCGILVGRDVSAAERLVDRLVPMKNVFDAAEQYHRFTIDPLAQLEAEKSADTEGRAVVGYYHSHPDHPAVPSEYDRQHVPPWSFYSHVIVSIRKGAPAEMRAWVLSEETEQFGEQALETRTEVKEQP